MADSILYPFLAPQIHPRPSFPSDEELARHLRKLLSYPSEVIKFNSDSDENSEDESPGELLYPSELELELAPPITIETFENRYKAAYYDDYLTTLHFMYSSVPVNDLVSPWPGPRTPYDVSLYFGNDHNIWQHHSTGPIPVFRAFSNPAAPFSATQCSFVMSPLLSPKESAELTLKYYPHPREQAPLISDGYKSLGSDSNYHQCLARCANTLSSGCSSPMDKQSSSSDPYAPSYTTESRYSTSSSSSSSSCESFLDIYDIDDRYYAALSHFEKVHLAHISHPLSSRSKLEFESLTVQSPTFLSMALLSPLMFDSPLPVFSEDGSSPVLRSAPPFSQAQLSTSSGSRSPVEVGEAEAGKPECLVASSTTFSTLQARAANCGSFSERSPSSESLVPMHLLPSEIVEPLLGVTSSSTFRTLQIRASNCDAFSEKPSSSGSSVPMPLSPRNVAETQLGIVSSSNFNILEAQASNCESFNEHSRSFGSSVSQSLSSSASPIFPLAKIPASSSRDTDMLPAQMLHYTPREQPNSSSRSSIPRPLLPSTTLQALPSVLSLALDPISQSGPSEQTQPPALTIARLSMKKPPLAQYSLSPRQRKKTKKRKTPDLPEVSQSSSASPKKRIRTSATKGDKENDGNLELAAMSCQQRRRLPRTTVPIPGLIKKGRGRSTPCVTPPNAFDSTNPSLSISKKSLSAPDVTAGEAEVPDLTFRPHICAIPLCGRAFTRKEHLRRHVICIHTEEKPFNCPYTWCKMTFSRGDNLNQHISTHVK